MAGSRERSGRPRRPAAREARMRVRLRGRTAREQVWIAWDWWRIEVGDDDGALRRMAEYLANEALALGRRRR